MGNKSETRKVSYSVNGFTWQGIESLNIIHECLEEIDDTYHLTIDGIDKAKNDYDKLSDLFNSIARFKSNSVDMFTDISNEYVAQTFSKIEPTYEISTINQFKIDAFHAALSLSQSLIHVLNQFDEDFLHEGYTGDLIDEFNEIACNLNCFFGTYMDTVPEWHSMDDVLDVPLIFFEEDH